MEEFYRSIQTGGVLPISHAEMLRVTRVMDEIFADCRSREAADVEFEQVPELQEAVR